ncbi:uncharacterized protein LOC122473383 [Prionailurus bengalensis]|uniref:uncharacterized protein LOC122473383 n=1 Tax=Prionailurus bengalensis TaxID=37029 RepID=UPI001CA7CB98|nr:uncharacterized protein LOC122473383 [Prionailurus bengalensis]
MLAAPGTFTGTQPPSHRGDPLDVCVNSPSASPRFGASLPWSRTAGPAAGVPLRGRGSRRQPNPAPLPRPLRGRLPKLPRSPAPACRGSCGVGLAGAPRRKGHQVSLHFCHLQRPRRRGGCAQFPRSGRPAGRGGRLLPGPRSGAGRFLGNFPPSSSLLWVEKEAEAPTSLQSDPLHQAPCHIPDRKRVGLPYCSKTKALNSSTREHPGLKSLLHLLFVSFLFSALHLPASPLPGKQIFTEKGAAVMEREEEVTAYL